MRSHHRPTLTWPCFALAMFLALGIIVWPTMAAATPQGALRQAWSRAIALGTYTYNTEVVQVTNPLPVLENANLHSKEGRFYLNGKVDLVRKNMEMKLWADGGSVSTGAGALEMKIENGKAFGRTESGDWQPINDISSAFAPGSDLLGYLAAAKNVQQGDSVSRAGISYTPYTFEINGPAFAIYMRDHVEANLREQGKLPPGLQMEVTRSYVDMTGTGELWVTADGLPLRQVVKLAIPDQHRPETVNATITTDFSGFDQAPLGPLALHQIQQLDGQGLALYLALFMALLGLGALLVRYWRSRRLYTTLVALVISSMLTTPLMQADQLQVFAAEQKAIATTTKQADEDAKALEAYNAEQAQKAFNPALNPLAQAPAISVAAPLAVETSTSSSVDSDADGLTDSEEQILKTNKDLADSDGDGLLDGAEVRDLGTSPLKSDSDADTLNDGLEVRGFTDTLGHQWYLDPNSADTNRDGAADPLECSGDIILSCRNSDGDALPDVIDTDDDGDGVPDNVDSAPYAALSGAMQNGSRTGLQDQRFSFSSNYQTKGKPLFVDLQIRPINPAHLWYSMNVLDWPIDKDGQIRRVFDDTFGDSGRSANGDMRLIPMLEIEIPFKAGTYGNLPTIANPTPITVTTELINDPEKQSQWFGTWLNKAELDRQGISIRLKNEKGDLLAYVPLNLVRDPRSQSPVAFSGRMLYQPFSDNFGTPHTMRLAWSIQIKQDACTVSVPAASAPTGEQFNQEWLRIHGSPDQPFLYRQWKSLSESERYDRWCSDTSHWRSALAIPQTYYDDWMITGLDVREDWGVDAAIVAEKAQSNGGFYSGTALPLHLWNLSTILDSTFLTGQCSDINKNTLCDANEQRDVTVKNFQNHLSNWGLPPDALKILPVSYADQSQLGDMAAFITPVLLNELYVESDSSSRVADTTLLFLREERFRQASLDMTSIVAINGNSVTFNLAEQDLPHQTQAAMSWAPFHYKGANVWQPTTLDSYLALFDQTLTQAFQQDGGELANDSNAIAGAVAFAKSYYLALHNGRGVIVNQSNINLQQPGPEDEDVALESNAVREISQSIFDGVEAVWADRLEVPAERGLEGASIVMPSLKILNIFGKIILSAEDSAGLELLDTTGRTLSLAKLSQFSKNKTWTKGSKLVGGLAMLATVGVGTMVAMQAAGVYGMSKLLSEMKVGMEWAAKGAEAAGAFADVYEAGKGIKNAKAALKGAQDAIKGLKNSATAARGAAIVGLVIETGIAIGLFFMQVSAENLDAGSLPYNDLLSMMIATIIVAVLMFAIALFVPIGTMVAAIIGLIDAIVGIVCKATGWDDSKNKIVKDYVCAGIAGSLAKIVQFLIYSQNPVVDMEAKDLVSPTNWVPRPKDSKNNDSFFQVGNWLEMSADIITTLHNNSPNSTLGAALEYQSHYTDPKYARNSTFRYEFTPTKEEHAQQIHERNKLQLGTMRTDWQDGEIKPSSYVLTNKQHITSDKRIGLNTAGINQHPTLYLAEGYAVQAQECWGLVSGRCTLEPKIESVYMDLSQSFVFDIFPATLDGFYRLEDRGGGGMALEWDKQFPVLVDADGDGLRSQAKGGNDPNDSTPDSDSDGLDDVFEIAQSGRGFNPKDADSDADGLSDYDEARFHTNPAQQDTDSDGLIDGDEVFHLDRNGQPAGGWQIVYGYDAANQPLITYVDSNPLEPDADHDLILDGREKIYGFNPRVYDDLRVLTIVATLDEQDGVQDGIVADNSEISYQADITNQLRDRYALGALEVELPPEATNLSLQRAAYKLPPATTTSIHGNIRIADLPHSEKIAFVNRATAVIADLRGKADGRVLWLRFDGIDRSVDSSQLGNIPLCNNASIPCPLSVEGHQGQAFRFGGGEHFEISHNKDLTFERYTVSMWVKPQKSTSEQFLITQQVAPNKQVNFALSLPPNSLKPRLVSHSFYCADPYSVAIHDFSSSTELNLDQWNFVTALYDGNYFAIYVNGKRSAEYRWDGQLCQSKSSILVGKDLNGTVIDEVSIYPEGLTEPRLLEAAKDAAFRFNYTSAEQLLKFNYTAPLPKAVYEGGTGAPATLNDRNSNPGALFDQSHWLTVAPSPDLDLSGGDGRFSFSMWLKPENVSVTDTWYGILGLNNGEGDTSYPSLFYKAGMLKLRFTSGNVTCTSSESIKLLNPGTWQHLSVTYDGEHVTFYVNGQWQDAQILTGGDCKNLRPRSSNGFEIGRASTRHSLDVYGLHLFDSGDGSTSAELELTVDGQKIWEHDNADPGWHQINKSMSWNSDNKHSLKLNELDPFDSDDRLLTLDFSNPWQGPQLSKYDLTGFQGGEGSDGTGELRWRVNNEYFKGGLDDIRIYRYAFDKDDALDLFKSDAQVLVLSFDEPPATSEFRDSSGNYMIGVCGTVCPLSGLPGRSNQVARFDGTTQVIVTDRPSLRLPNEMTVSAWVNLENSQPNQTIVSKIGTLEDKQVGYSLAVSEGKLLAQIYDFANAQTYTVHAGSVPANSWVHLALTARASDRLIGYVNGEPVGQVLITNGRGYPVAGEVRTADQSLGELFLAAEFLKKNSWDSLDIGKGFLEGATDIYSTYDDEISSLTLWDACITVFDETFYQGDNRVYCEDESNLGAWDDRISSIRRGGSYPTAKGDYIDFDRSQRQHLAAFTTQINAPQFDQISIGAFISVDPNDKTPKTIASRGTGSDSAIVVDYGIPLSDWIFQVGDQSGGKLRLYIGGQWFVSSRALSDDQWHHVAATYDGSKVRFYIDGQSAGEANYNKPISNSRDGRSPIYIGRRGRTTYNEFFQGKLRDLIIYRNAFSSDQIATVQNNPNDLPASGGVFRMRFNEPAGAQTFSTYIPQEFKDSASPLLIGRAIGSTSGVRGLIDEVQVLARALSADEVRAQTQAAPLLVLNFDERVGASSFANSTNTDLPGMCAFPGCPQAGLKGQIRDSILFDGIDDQVTVKHIPALDFTHYSVSTWVKPAKIKNKEQLLVALAKDATANLANYTPYYGLWLAPGSMKVAVGDCATPIISDHELIPDQWNQVITTFDGGTRTIQLYINGTHKASIARPQSSCGTSMYDLMMGRQPFSGEPFDGALDEAVIYGSTLTERQVKALYNYQSAWFDIAVVHDIVVDAEPPIVAAGFADGLFIRNQSIILAITARDVTSAISRVEVNTGDGWRLANLEPNKTIWMFDYTPAGAGEHVIEMRAYDSVGHMAATSARVRVDEIAPTVSITAGGPIVRAEPQDGNIWLLHLSGQATDDRTPVNLTVTLRDSNGGPVGSSLALTNISGDWSGDYLLPFPPNGQFTAEVEAHDSANNFSHTQTKFAIDNMLPEGTATVGSLALAGTGADRPLLHGVAGDFAIPNSPSLTMAFEEPSGAFTFFDGSANQLKSSCVGTVCPAAGLPGRYGAGLTFDGSDDSITIDLNQRGQGGVAAGAPFTLAGWVRADAVNGHTVLSARVGGQEALQIAITNNGTRINAWMNFGEWKAAGQGPLVLNEWNHIAFVYDGETVHSYVNGVLTYEQQQATGSFHGFDTLWVGSLWGSAEFLAGQVDDLLLYDRVIDEPQIQSLLNQITTPIAMVEVGLLHAKDRNNIPAAIQWRPATLGQAGQPVTTWSYQMPEGIEGPHQIQLRITDQLGNLQVLPNVWSGEIDTQAPQIRFSYLSIVPGSALVSCEATDYNLDETRLNCPIPASEWQRVNQAASWYQALFGVAGERAAPQKLETIRTAKVTIGSAANTMSACDSFGNCATIANALGVSIHALTGVSAVISPTVQQVFTSLDPIAIQGYARAEAGLSSLDVTVDGTPLYTTSWPGADVERIWNTTYTPTSEGVHPIQATLLDRSGNTIADSTGPRVYVDLNPPVVALSTTAISTANAAPGGMLIVAGTITETVGLQHLQVRLDDGVWQDLPLPGMPAASTPFSTTIFTGITSGFDGQQFVLHARAIDIAGRTVEVSRTVLADSTPPTLGQITLEYPSGAATGIVVPGGTITTTLNPNLTIRWAPAIDTSGIVRYLVGWTTTPTATLSDLTSYPNGTTSHTRNSADAQRLWAHVVAEDTLGNQTSRTLGPIYVDHGQTPAYISMDEFGQPYRGHMLDQCSQIGFDNRLSYQGGVQNRSQQFYATWNDQGLRLTWAGANWNTEGDLFIYLDTQPGVGSNQAYDPYPATAGKTTMLLAQRTSGPMLADYLIWVQDSTTATLMHWDGTLWQPVAAPWAYHFDANLPAPTIDLYVPFSTLNITDPAATELSLLAFASEEAGLRTWATMPANNSLTSERILGQGNVPEIFTARLRNAYRWAGLVSAICPRGLDASSITALSANISPQAAQPIQFSDADVKVKMTSTAPGVIYGLLGDNLFMLSESAGGTQANSVGSEQGTALVALGEGDTLAYTLSFSNRGYGPAEGLRFRVRSYGSLRLQGSARGSDANGSFDELTLDAGSLAVGMDGSLTFNATVDRSSVQPGVFSWDSLTVVAYDATGSAEEGWIDQISAEHQIDFEAPRHLEITTPQAVIGAGQTILTGMVADTSPVPTINVEAKSSAGMVTSVLCNDPTPTDHSWTCTFDAGAATDGQTFQVRVRATDSHNQTSTWSEWQAFIVDTTAPSLALSPESEAAMLDNLIGPAEATLSGSIDDNRVPAAVLVCDQASGACESAELEGTDSATVVTVLDTPGAPIILDAAQSCAAGTFTRTFTVAEALTVADVDLGLTLAGVPHGQLRLTLTAPSGTQATLIAESTGSGQGYNMRLDDAAQLLVRDDTTTHTMAKPFSVAVAPAPDKLTVFNGELAQGLWTLAICTGASAPITSEYRAAALFVRSQHTPTDGTTTWRYTIPIAQGSDGVAKTYSIYGVDTAGNNNRTNAITRTVRLDNVAPALIVDSINLDEDGNISLNGTSSDGSPIKALRLALLPPNGQMFGAPITTSAAWSYAATDPLDQSGAYTAWVEAEDSAGNKAIVDAGELNWIVPQAEPANRRILLPIIVVP